MLGTGNRPCFSCERDLAKQVISVLTFILWCALRRRGLLANDGRVRLLLGACSMYVECTNNVLPIGPAQSKKGTGEQSVSCVAQPVGHVFDVSVTVKTPVIRFLAFISYCALRRRSLLANVGRLRLLFGAPCRMYV